MLKSLKNDEINGLLDVLEEYLEISDINELKPFESYRVNVKISRYCIICGNSFMDENDVFCTNCGAKRI